MVLKMLGLSTRVVNRQYMKLVHAQTQRNKLDSPLHAACH